MKKANFIIEKIQADMIKKVYILNRKLKIVP
jgi:hypothetical protein